MNAQTLRIKWLAPMVFLQLYLMLSVVLFFFGPWNWKVGDPALLGSYLATAQLCIASGYLLAWKKIRKLHTTTGGSELCVRSGIKFLKGALLITFLFMIPTSLSRTGSALPDIFSGLSKTGAVYNENFERLERGNAYVVVEYLRMVMSPLLTAVFPLALVYWSRLSVRLKLLCLAAIFFNLGLYISTGTNKGLADAVITLPWLIFLGLSVGTLRFRFTKRFLVAISLMLLVGFLQFFGIGQTEREGGVGALGVFNSGFSLLHANKDHPISAMLPDSQRIIFESLARYLGQGYYALSLSLDIEHSSTFGVGHSMFLARNADSIFGTHHFTQGSIPGLLETQTGWGMFSLWHSIYPWLASDVGFAGALLVLGALSYLFGVSWGRSLMTADPRAITLSYLLLILFFYIPANNQIFQSGETCVAFILLLFDFLIRKRILPRRHLPRASAQTPRLV